MNKEAKEKTAEDSIKERLDAIEVKYNAIIERLEKEVIDDRTHAQETYFSIKNIINIYKDDGGKPSPGILQALNSAITNLQNSTQREKEILQEVAKKQQQLETLYELSKDPDDSDFDRNELLD